MICCCLQLYIYSHVPKHGFVIKSAILYIFYLYKVRHYAIDYLYLRNNNQPTDVNAYFC